MMGKKRKAKKYEQYYGEPYEEWRRRAKLKRPLEKADEASLEVARIIGKMEAGKKLTAQESLMVLPYLIVEDIENMMKEFKETGKIKRRRKLLWY